MKRGENMLTIAIIGAAGKMGSRITDNLSRGDYSLLLCEKGDAGISRIRERGFSNTETKRAVPSSDVIIMAVPDAKIGGIFGGKHITRPMIGRPPIAVKRQCLCLF